MLTDLLTTTGLQIFTQAARRGVRDPLQTPWPPRLSTHPACRCCMPLPH